MVLEVSQTQIYVAAWVGEAKFDYLASMGGGGRKEELVSFLKE